MRNCVHVCLALALFYTSALGSNHTTVKQCKKLYDKGVEAYLDERWSDCIDNFENGVQAYKSYTKDLARCRLKCKKEAADADSIYSVDVERIYFFENVVMNTLCLLKCTDAKHSKNDVQMLKDVKDIYDMKKPYEYLHVCYFQKLMLPKAASAAYTYLVTNQEDEAMSKNFRYYITLPEVDETETTNFDAEEHMYLYTHGSAAYDKKSWKEVVHYMEESLASYLEAEEECRALCEGPFDAGWFLDLTPAIANHFTYCLKCKQRCSTKLNNLNGKYYEDLLPSHYHYLQYAYYKVGDLKAACSAASTYLLFLPSDETMFSNIEFYKTMPKIDADYFIPRPEAVKYIQRKTYEQKLLAFISNEFEPVKKEKTSPSLKGRSSSIEIFTTVQHADIRS